MKKVLLFGIFILLSLAMMTIWQSISFNDGKMHVVFCDVGQGDAVLIKTPNNKFILVDGGPDGSVLHCLARHMPFWKREIDLMLLTHPHADHFFGMFYVLERYAVKAFATEDLVNETKAYEELQRLLEQKKVPSQHVLAGDVWGIEEVRVEVVGPTDAYLAETSPGGMIGESKEFASLILRLQYGDFKILLTGDSQVRGLENAASALDGGIDVLHVPHHGSGSGLDNEVLETLGPDIAVISVGAENRYNHPHPQIMELLQSHQITTLRTDQKGDIEIVSDGNQWQVIQKN
jgi:competence protein ComEC